MINKELNNYIKEQLKQGAIGESIFNDLIDEGWVYEEIVDNIDKDFFEINDKNIIVKKIAVDKVKNTDKSKFNKKGLLITVFFLLCLCVVMVGFSLQGKTDISSSGVILVSEESIIEDPQLFLNKIADDIEQKGSFTFKRISGGEGFVLGSGEVILPDSVREVKYGGMNDVYFVKLQESPDVTILDYFPSDKFDYLGGFGSYAAFAQKGEDDIGYFESVQTETGPDNPLFRILESPALTSENSDIIGVWKKIPHDHEYVLHEGVSPSLPLFVPGILRSAASNTIEVSNIESDTVIRYFAVSKTLAKFGISGFSNWTDRNNALNEKIFFEVTITVSANSELKDMVVEVFSLDQDRTAAYKIFFDSFGSVDRIDMPEDETKTPYSLEGIVLPEVKSLDVRIGSEVRNVSPLPSMEVPVPVADANVIQVEDRVFEGVGAYMRVAVGGDVDSEIHVYDKDGGHTGSIKPPFVGGRDMEDYAILASLSGGSQKSIGIDLGGTCDYYPEKEKVKDCIPESYFLVVINATDKNEGLLHFNIDNGQGDDLSNMYLKATKKSRGTMEVTSFDEDIVVEKLKYDYDGDGVTDYELSHNSPVPAEIEFNFDDFEAQAVSEDVFMFREL